MSELVFRLERGVGFREGVARIFDFGNTLTRYKMYRTPAEADAAALGSDWAAVGDDLRDAMREAKTAC